MIHFLAVLENGPQSGALQKKPHRKAMLACFFALQAKASLA